MTVYVGTDIADKPRVQHLAKPITDDDWGQQLSLCRRVIGTAEQHAARRRHWYGSTAFTPIDYDQLPMCKRCTNTARKAEEAE